MKSLASKKTYLFPIILAVFAVQAFADIPSPRKSPTPTPAPKAVPVEYNGVIRVYIDRTGKVDVPVLEVRQSAVERLIASNGEGGNLETLAGAPVSGFSATQTIVSGTLFSLAFIVGGIWIIRAKGNSKTAAGILLGAALGAGTIVLANAPPDSAVTLTSRIFNKSTTAYGYAKNKVKIRLIEEKEYINGDARDDVVLIVPKVDGEGGE